MKKSISLALVAVLLLTVLFTGCGNSELTERSSSTQIETRPSSGASTTAQSNSSGADTDFEESDSATSQQSQTANQNITEEKSSEMKMNVQVGGRSFTATLEENAAAEALADMMRREPVTIQMSDYSGFEKVGSLGTALPANDVQTTTHAGDIVLYQGNQIVMFYGSNSWSYTRLGHIDNLDGWEEAIGSGDVTVTFSLEK